LDRERPRRTLAFVEILDIRTDRREHERAGHVDGSGGPVQREKAPPQVVGKLQWRQQQNETPASAATSTGPKSEPAKRSLMMRRMRANNLSVRRETGGQSDGAKSAPTSSTVKILNGEVGPL